MGKTVFIFGVGASAVAGAPTMDIFLDTAFDLWRRPPPDSKLDEQSFGQVFDALKDSRGLKLNTLLDVENIETFFSTLEMARRVQKFPSRAMSRIDELHAALVRVIVQTIEYSMKFTLDKSVPIPNGDYRKFGVDLKQTLHETGHKDFSFLTFNYDIGLDYTLYSNDIPFTYCLAPEFETKGFPLLKLHGSINWGVCQGCKQIADLPMKWLRNSQDRNEIRVHQKTLFATLGSRIEEGSHCDIPLNGPPVIVPPTLEKGQYESSISTIWQRAAKELGQAENVFVIGYSLPPADLFFRYLLGLGLEGGPLTRRFWVFNPDRDVVKKRFDDFIGPAIKPRYRYHPTHFIDAIDEICKDLKKHS